MVNKKLGRTVAPPPGGLPCGRCGLPGLVVDRQRIGHDGSPRTRAVLLCYFCDSERPRRRA